MSIPHIGMGGTDLDSHLALPVIESSADFLRDVDLRPWRAAMQVRIGVVCVLSVCHAPLCNSLTNEVLHAPVVCFFLLCLVSMHFFPGFVLQNGSTMFMTNHAMYPAPPWIQRIVRLCLNPFSKLCFGA